MEAELKTLAERYFRGVYSCDLSVIDELASEDIVVSYPIFEKILNKHSIQGRLAVRDFNAGFCKRWTDMHITIHESIAENNQAVLIWSYRAKNIGSAIQGQEPSNKEESWGGITLIRFNKAGKISAEIGEESAPGPFARIKGGESDSSM